MVYGRHCYGRHGHVLWPSWSCFVAVMVCGRHCCGCHGDGLWPSWFVAVMVMVCGRRCCGRHGIGLIVLSGQVIAQDLNDDYEFFDTPESPATMDNSFMGYSIAVGHFNNDSLTGVNGLKIHLYTIVRFADCLCAFLLPFWYDYKVNFSCNRPSYIYLVIMFSCCFTPIL